MFFRLSSNFQLLEQIGHEQYPRYDGQEILDELPAPKLQKGEGQQGEGAVYHADARNADERAVYPLFARFGVLETDVLIFDRQADRRGA